MSRLEPAFRPFLVLSSHWTFFLHYPTNPSSSPIFSPHPLCSPSKSPDDISTRLCRARCLCPLHLRDIGAFSKTGGPCLPRHLDTTPLFFAARRFYVNHEQ
ncbi:uncharacterized protein LAJ45_06225 [Morchella importuna]|uniref:uncharacterized protein n=1 Tax=Morchella importuna TaxID=1174673 RepID=UPI001E8E8937|nr:uncharacterized protein LAJ45_06225 [Morchella importuna]KAH8149595.1 hypothetical protein LAJ45_06225 [Morchella importuna]